ncbi:hypothetical protein Tco_0160682 [Tanacetum coccineum]
MPPKRTSTSATPAMTQDAIQQLVADSVATTLKAQAANMANTDNTNKNTRTSGTPIGRKGINNHKRKFEDRGNIINNNYQNNHNNNNRNNDYHRQQNRRQETFRTYTATNGYAGNLPLWPQENILRDELNFVHFRISTLETTLEDIQLSSESSSI